MPVTPTYPGVYIEEIPSGVHTITGVATSITAFVGYTQKGAVDEAVHIFSFADFERAFGGLSVDSPLSYCAKHFFQNGGTEAYVVRVAQGAASASVTLRNGSGNNVLVISAISAGIWGNSLQIDVDYDTGNPSNLFNLRVTEYVERNGDWVPGPSEVYRNLTLNSGDPRYVIAILSTSQLITASLVPGLAVAAQGQSQSGTLAGTDLAQLGVGNNRVAVRVNGQGPYEVTFAVPTVTLPVSAATLQTLLTGIAGDIVTKVNAVAGAGALASPPGVANGVMTFTSGNNSDRSAVQFQNASMNSATAILKLGFANGGTEFDGAAGFRPAQTGTVGVPGAVWSTTASVSTSGALTAPIVLATDLFLWVSVNGQAPVRARVPAATYAAVSNAATAVASAINAALGVPAVAGTAPASSIVITSADPTKWTAIHLTSAATDDAAAFLKLGLDNGGTEDASLTISVRKGAIATVLTTINIPLWGFWGVPKATIQPGSLDDVAVDIDTALKSLANSEPYLAGASAQRIGNAIRILPGSTDPNDPNTSFDVSVPGTNPALAFPATPVRNVARYAPGMGASALFQVAGTTGSDGSAPTNTDLTGDEAGKTGLYALEDVDLFNLLVMPDATAGAGMIDVLTEAIEYCVRRRAFMIIDAPETVATFAQAQTWISGPASALRSRNDALYFPRLREPDPLMSGVVGTFAAAGALAGIYARTDADRGVWKAPAGTTATLMGATGLSYTLTDGENGALNPKGLNCLRTFPIIGTVSWGARTGNGADALADEYKYIPVRRLALFLEESLYRGTQWVVFEPNDEPLWAQIRLNVGAFMHSLYAQGAFQGQTPRDAYFVKCDKDTTTANDQDLGRVNIVVGFAPLKPAEFVIIQIQQIVPNLQT
jgi:phage tail sheath protein FI